MLSLWATYPWSIPARAGEPGAPCWSSKTLWVYPRACGGTGVMLISSTPQYGLSPRVRGNRCHWAHPPRGPRSIPARAGEPPRSLCGIAKWAVYPRACGGTEGSVLVQEEGDGLSPRVRGNRTAPGITGRRWRSIPARAGEPDVSPLIHSAIRVYPRACGGTGQAVAAVDQQQGLSPRVRGNHAGTAAQPGGAGSIPARAGEPHRLVVPPDPARVYPRACGGTDAGFGGRVPVEGLSPRVRGNRPLVAVVALVLGSIPARAGEPPWYTERSRRDGVYPRACGGTGWAAVPASVRWGLSPRVRGNL